MASSWLDSWGASWGDAWGQQLVDPNALRGTAAGSSTAGATLSAVARISGSSAGSSTAQAYMELDDSAAIDVSGLPWLAVTRRAPARPAPPRRPIEDDEAGLMLSIF